MKRVAGFSLNKKFLRNLVIGLVIVAVAYVVMRGVKEGFQGIENKVIKYINISDPSKSSYNMDGNTYMFTDIPKGQKLVSFDMEGYFPAKINTNCKLLTSKDDDKYFSTVSSYFGKSTSAAQVFLEATNSVGGVVNIYNKSLKVPGNKWTSNTRRLGATDIPEGKPGGPPSANDIANGIKVKNLTTNALQIAAKGGVCNRLDKNNGESDTRLTFMFA